MEVLRQSGPMVTVSGHNTKMAKKKDSWKLTTKMEESTISSSRTVRKTVMEYNTSIMEKFIKVTSKMANATDMESWSLKIMLSIMANGLMAKKTE